MDPQIEAHLRTCIGHLFDAIKKAIDGDPLAIADDVKEVRSRLRLISNCHRNINWLLTTLGELKSDPDIPFENDEYEAGMIPAPPMTMPRRARFGSGETGDMIASIVSGLGNTLGQMNPGQEIERLSRALSEMNSLKGLTGDDKKRLVKIKELLLARLEKESTETAIEAIPEEESSETQP